MTLTTIAVGHVSIQQSVDGFLSGPPAGSVLGRRALAQEASELLGEIDRALAAQLPEKYLIRFARRSYIELAGSDGKPSRPFPPDVRVTAQPSVEAGPTTMQAFVVDRAGHYEFLTRLVPGARHLTIGGSDDEHAVNPWDVDDPSHPPL